MENYNDPREYLQEEKGSLAIRILYRTFIYIIIFHLVFMGVPLPFISRSAPKPLRVAKEILETKTAEAVQIKRVQYPDPATFSTFTATDAVMSPTLSPVVDTNNAFLLQSSESDNMPAYYIRAKFEAGGEGSGIYTSIFSGSDSLTVRRSRIDSEYSTTGKTGNSVVEFTSAVTMLQGSSTVAPSVTSQTITLPQSIDIDKS
ncbi:MAG: hypothetical protein KAX15_02660, partial [Candidatus Omnitrophica bacterium]|nr:hypothetical protein [Candidatus Omnitrophota bacterium]